MNDDADKLPPLVIVNPASRGGAGARDWARAATALATHFGAFDKRFTDAPGHATELAREAASSGRRLLLTFGGDGTISEVARGIVAASSGGADCELGVLPHGTGGDFVRSLGVPNRIADAARGLRDGATISIDVGKIRFDDGSERIFVNSASFGLSGDVAYRANQGPKSSTSYARHTLAAGARYEFPEVLLSRDGSEERVRITSVSLHNGKYFGGGMKMAPAADLTDGELQLVLVKKMSSLKLVTLAPLMYWGAHLGVSELEHGPVRSLHAAPADESQTIRIEVDGESPGNLPARFEVLPAALRVRLPPR